MLNEIFIFVNMIVILFFFITKFRLKTKKIGPITPQDSWIKKQLKKLWQKFNIFTYYTVMF